MEDAMAEKMTERVARPMEVGTRRRRVRVQSPAGLLELVKDEPWLGDGQRVKRTLTQIHGASASRACA